MHDITVCANHVAEELDANIFVYSGTIDDIGYGLLVSEMISENSSDIRPNAVLILTTNGGIADSAYKIARLLQKSHENLFLFIPSFCKSAGTLIALGASELYLTELSELGPLDVQLFQQDELFKSRSGLVVRTAFEGLAEEAFKLYEHIMIGIKTKSGSIVSFETASRIASNITTDMMGKVYSQINPEILGSDLRNLHIATEYGHRLANRGMNVREGAIQALISGYPSHEFVIDDAECEKLFHRVRRPSPTLDGLMMRLGEIVYYEQQTHVVRRLNGVTAPKGEDDEAREIQHADDGSSLDVGRKEKRRSNPARGSETEPRDPQGSNGQEIQDDSG